MRIDSWTTEENQVLVNLYFSYPEGRKGETDSRVKAFAQKYERAVNAVTMKMGQIDSIVNPANTGLPNIQKSLIDIVEDHGHVINRDFSKGAKLARSNKENKLTLDATKTLFKQAVQAYSVDIRKAKIFTKTASILDEIRIVGNADEVLAKYVN